MDVYELAVELMYEDEFLEYYEALTIAEVMLNRTKEVTCNG